jgi:GTPase SAR1 family protein
MSQEEIGLVKGLIFSVFEDEGPVPIVTLPEEMEEIRKLTISMKSISLLMGDNIYQEGGSFDSIKYFGILPFPEYNLTAMTYFFLIEDENARGKAKASTISLMVDDSHAAFIYENMKDLSVYFAETAPLMQSTTDLEELHEIMLSLREQFESYVTNIHSPIETTRNLKILFTGLDASGKTSFLRAIKEKYSELTGIKPTKGIERGENKVLGVKISEWDVGGQKKYRQNFLKQADFYLYDTNLLTFLIDVRDNARFTEAITFFGEIIKIFRSFNQSPPVVVCLHKFDPDIQEDPLLNNNIQVLQDQFEEIARGFNIKFFKTSIFNPYTLNKAFSAGISAMSPNRDILRGQLTWLSNETDAQAMLLIDENNIILSDLSKNEMSQQVTELSAPHFKNLYRTFYDFKLLKQNDFVIWRMESEVISFINIKLEKTSIYLLSLLPNDEKIIKKLEKKIKEFTSRIEPLIQTFL